MTALSGGSISEESFAISTAILAAPYAAFQADSLDDPGSSGALSVGSQDGGMVGETFALVDVTGVLRSLAWSVVSSCCMCSTIGVGCMSGGLLVGVADDKTFFRKRRRMMDERVRQRVWVRSPQSDRRLGAWAKEKKRTRPQRTGQRAHDKALI